MRNWADIYYFAPPLSGDDLNLLPIGVASEIFMLAFLFDEELFLAGM